MLIISNKYMIHELLFLNHELFFLNRVFVFFKYQSFYIHPLLRKGA
jgi:hypothetical protein